MPESEHIQKDIAAVRTRLDQIESMQRLIVASDKGVREHVESFLAGRDNAAEVVVMLADGPLVQSEIVTRLGKSQSTVSKVLKHLYDHGLLLVYPDLENAKQKRWGLNDLESTVNAVKIAQAIISERKKAQD